MSSPKLLSPCEVSGSQQAASPVAFLLLHPSCLSHSLVLKTTRIFCPHWKSNTLGWFEEIAPFSREGALCVPLTSGFLGFLWAQSRLDICKPAKGNTGGFGNTGVDWNLQFIVGFYCRNIHHKIPKMRIFWIMFVKFTQPWNKPLLYSKAFTGYQSTKCPWETFLIANQ